MLLIERHIIKPNDTRYKDLCEYLHKSKNLYNAALYAIRQYYFSHKDEIGNKYLNYYAVDKLFKETHNPDYYALPIDISQQVLKQVNQNFKSFFKLLKLKKQGKYDKPVKLPKYKNKNGYNTITINAVKLGKKLKTDGIVAIPNIKLQFKNIINYKTCTQIRFIPKPNYIEMEVIYNSKEKELKADNKRYMSIDLGVDNLCAVSSNVIKSELINGKNIKQINHNWNKRKAYLQSRLSENQYNSNLITSITNKRNFRIQNYFHKVSKYIVNHAVSNNINTIIIGHTNEWKQETNIGEVNNQNFVQIPFNQLIQQIQYKGKLQGINIVIQEESYTSKASFFDNDFIPVYDPDKPIKYKFSGYRKNRGLYKSKIQKKYINADINGSLNIMRKYLQCNSDAIISPADIGLVVSPVKVNL